MIRGDAVEESLFVRAGALVLALRIESDTDAGPLIEHPPADLDPEILKRLRQMYEAGGWVLVESALADVPGDLRWLYESGAVTLDQLGAIHRALGATSAADLATAVREQQIRAVAGLDADVEAAIGAALPTLRALTPRVPLGRATAIADTVLERLRGVPGVDWAQPVGSLRRGRDMVGDIEIVAASSQPAVAIADLLTVPETLRILHQGERRLYLLIERIQVAVRLPDPANAGAALLYLTGSPAHFEALRTRAAASGWRLTADGLHGSDGMLRPSATEDAIYSALGLPCIPPEIRESGDEIAVAGGGALAALVSRADIRGDLHMHSLWSDGRDSIEAMVQASIALGYEYVAITDHSPSSAAIRNLTLDGVNRQADEIAALRERYPSIAILHGCEVDILPDGRLDFPDRILDRFDIVLASLHDSAGHAPEQLMKRYTLAIQHPLVTLITHPTNRMIPHRPGYDIDYDRLFEAAVDTGTFLEIDGAPGHLDMNGAMSRRAIAAGVSVAIDSDCHRAVFLARQMDLGVATARRGWVEPRHVINSRPLADVRAAIARKRAS